MIIIISKNNCKTVLFQAGGLKKYHNSLNSYNSMKTKSSNYANFPNLISSSTRLNSCYTKLDW